MRVSEVASWSACERMAMSSPRYEPGRGNIAAWVGTLAHGRLAGIEPEHPGRLNYDPTTPSNRQAEIQAQTIANYARALMGDQGWSVVGQDEALESNGITGHLDIRAWHSEHGEAIIDLKTGQLPSTAWLQVGGYIYLAGHIGGTGNEGRLAANCGGVLHVPRVRTNKPQTGTLEMRKADDLMYAFRIAWESWTEVQQGAPPLMTPGVHCGRCKVSGCPVRAGGES